MSVRLLTSGWDRIVSRARSWTSPTLPAAIIGSCEIALERPMIHIARGDGRRGKGRARRGCRSSHTQRSTS